MKRSKALLSRPKNDGLGYIRQRRPDEDRIERHGDTTDYGRTTFADGGPDGDPTFSDQNIARIDQSPDRTTRPGDDPSTYQDIILDDIIYREAKNEARYETSQDRQVRSDLEEAQEDLQAREGGEVGSSTVSASQGCSSAMRAGLSNAQAGMLVLGGALTVAGGTWLWFEYT